MNTSPSTLPLRCPAQRCQSRLAAWLHLLLGLFCLLGATDRTRAQVAGSMDIWPRATTVSPGSTVQFGAYVPISPNTVTWLVNDVAGGDATFGTISASGLYTPPAVIPAANVVTIKARSTAYPTSFASTPLSITRKYPWLWSVYPSSLVVGNFKVSLNGSNFAPDSQVLANGVAITTTYVSPTSLKAAGTASQAGTLQFAVRQPGNGAVTGNTVNVTVGSAPITVAVSPATATVVLGASQPFTATVSGTANTAVTWSVNGYNGGNATVGTITTAGVYTAPAVMPASPSISIRAYAVASPDKFAQANVTLSAPPPPVTVTVAPGSATVQLGNSQPFTATVSGSANTAVTWSVNGTTGGNATVGTISTAGVYTAPATMPASPTVTIRATSVANPAGFAQASVSLTSPPPVSVAISPASASVQLGTSVAFAATVTGNANTAVIWSVNGTTGGNATVGTISAAGLYTAPATMPASPTVTVRATAAVNATAFAQSTVTLTVPPPITVAVTPASATVQTGASQPFAATVTGSANTAVTWSVNGIAGGSALVGFISAAGLYTAPAAVPAPATVSIRATSAANGTSFAQSTVTVIAPPPPSTSLSAARFLEQSSFGPSPATLARVQQLGIPAYLDEQFGWGETPIYTPPDNSMSPLRQWSLYNAATAPDQLRQRVAYALGQIIVTSGNKLVYANEILPWMRLLSLHAFGNYRTLLRDVSMSPSMGKYLDLANSMKPGPAGGANENYARELMQLFSIGLWELNQDGSFVIDGLGFAIPTYDQSTVAQVARTLTGWTYATAPGATPQNNNWEYFGAPMEPRQQNHDTSAKAFLGCTVPPGQTVQQDLDSLIDCLMNHPNIAPFVCTRLIRSLVTSNPSAGYIQRVSDVFVNNGVGVRGDLKAVVRAILLDPEARQDTPTVNQGRLKEPILQTVGLLRALNGGFTPNHGLVYLYDYMAQPILAPPSVFSWFSPLYRVPKSPLFGPEFQIYSPTESMLRGNFMLGILQANGGDMTVDLSPFQPYGNDMPNLVEAVNQVLLYGRMPAGMKQALITAATPGYDAKTRIETVLYLTALSGQYAVQY